MTGAIVAPSNTRIVLFEAIDCSPTLAIEFVIDPEKLPDMVELFKKPVLATPLETTACA